MKQPKGDPFFEQLKADVQEALNQADRGEAVDESAVWGDLAELRRALVQGPESE